MTNNELIEKLNQIRDLSSGGNPNAEWVSSNKEILMSQIKPNSQNESPVREIGDSFYYGQYINSLFRQSFLKPALATFSLVFVMLGYSATLSVANASLPGDMFYPIKTAKEKVQMAFTFEDEEKVKLQMTFVSNRADELQQLVKTTDGSDKTTEVVKKTAQQITKDINIVKDNLNKISVAAVSSDKEKIIEVAKEVDTKTMEVKQGLVETHSILSKDVKKDVEIDLKKAISSTEETGTSALNVIIEKYKSGESVIDGNEVASRVAERIKDAETNIEGATKVIENVTTSTSAIISSKNAVIPVSTTTSTVPTLNTIKDQPQVAQAVIAEAKDLLDQKDFSSALEKITETNKIVSTVEESVRVIENTNSTSPTSTSSSL